MEVAQADLQQWSGARVLVTGGTGFLGSWIVSTLLLADQVLGLNLEVDLLTRATASVPIESTSRVRVVEGDVRGVRELGQFEVIIHAAASSSAASGHQDAEPRQIAETIVRGTENILEMAACSGSRVLFLSSGAVYGRQVTDRVSETDRGGPDTMDPRSVYGEAKRMAENLCAVASRDSSVNAVVGRLFAFVGPRLPLNAHFAAGNFLRDALASKPIRVEGDRRVERSYLYAGDLPEWCFALLSRGTTGEAYNIGSPVSVTIGELASIASELTRPHLPVQFVPQPRVVGPNQYVPSTEKARTGLGLAPRVDLKASMKKTYRWALESGAD